MLLDGIDMNKFYFIALSVDSWYKVKYISIVTCKAMN